MANGWAAFLDFSVGTGIVAVMSMFQASLLQICIGGALALLPDYIHIPWLLKVFRGEKITEDHHRTWSHRPVFILTGATVIAWHFGGMLWADIAFLCVCWHFLHDYPFGDGFLNWFWPLKADHHVPVDHEKWIEENWLTSGIKFKKEVGAGIAILVAALFLTNHRELAILAFIILTCMFFAWELLTKRYASAT